MVFQHVQILVDCCLVARMTSQLFPSCGHAGHTQTQTRTLPGSLYHSIGVPTLSYPQKIPTVKTPIYLFVFSSSVSLSLSFSQPLSLSPCLQPFITPVFILSFSLYLCQDWFPFPLSQAALSRALQYSQCSLLICTRTHTHTHTCMHMHFWESQ